MESELKPCECGEIPVFEQRIEDLGRGTERVLYLFCTCGNRAGPCIGPTQEDALISWWNDERGRVDKWGVPREPKPDNQTVSDNEGE